MQHGHLLAMQHQRQGQRKHTLWHKIPTRLQHNLVLDHWDINRYHIFWLSFL